MNDYYCPYCGNPIDADEALMMAVWQLPPARMRVMIRTLLGQSISEIARVDGMSEKAVASTLAKARRDIRRMCSKQ